MLALNIYVFSLFGIYSMCILYQRNPNSKVDKESILATFYPWLSQYLWFWSSWNIPFHQEFYISEFASLSFHHHHHRHHPSIYLYKIHTKTFIQLFTKFNQKRKKEINYFKMALKLKDTFYISHGSPTLSIDESITARKFLQSWKKDVFQERPRAILVISGHWDTAVPTVNVIETTNDTIHDFYGFPKPMYQVSTKHALLSLLL